MNVVHCIGGLSVASGGPAQSVPALAAAMARQGADVHLAYVAGSHDVELDGNSAVPLHCRPSRPRALGASRELRRRLIAGPRFDVYHAHGIWLLPTRYAARAAHGHDASLLIAPRGMLEAWGVARSRWKKRIVGWLYQNKDLREADCLHAITPSEVDSFRAYGLDNPIAVVPNGVGLEEFAPLEEYEGRLAELHPATHDRPVALFLSRLHPKKGLPHLVEAWAQLRRDHPYWLLVIVGPDDVGHRAEVEGKVQDLGVEDSILFTGPMYGKDKLAAFAAADIFVLPSFSEGFSMAVLEALACRLPVLITPGCNFPEVAEHDAGVIVEPHAEGTEAGLRRLMEMTEPEREAMGARGRALAEANYTWDKVAAQMIEVYEWLLGCSPRPEQVKMG